MKFSDIPKGQITPDSLEELFKKRIKDAQGFYQSKPFATKSWMVLHGFPIQFLNANCDLITADDKK
jgi:hypothetical protein